MKTKARCRRRQPLWPKIFLGVITVLQLTLTIIVHIMNRREILHALQNEDEMTVIQNCRKENYQLAHKK